MNEAYWLPVIFAGLMGLAILVYAMLDGYDLGVGILLPPNSREDRDTMIASIGPFWDANETWLVLAVGILLIAFPAAHNVVLKALYLPATIMLGGLILRGVAFDFRAKAYATHKNTWDKVFKAGSLLATGSQGYMLGMYVMGFEVSWRSQIFAIVSAACVTAAYTYIGGAWLVMKTEDDLQRNAASWTRKAGWIAALGVVLVCLVNPLMSEQVFEKWFSLPQIIYLFPIPLLSAVLFVLADRYLKRVPHEGDRGCWLPFVCAAAIFLLSFVGLAYSYFPFVVPDRLTVWEAASAPVSLKFILVGVLLVVPAIIGYTLFSYRVFWGKATELKYY